MRSLNRAWHWLIEPAPRLSDPDDREHARLLNALLLVMLPAVLCIQLAADLPGEFLMFHTSNEILFVVPLFGVGAVAFVLSRLGHFRPAAVLIIWGTTLTIFGIGLTDETAEDLAYLVLPVLVSAFILPRRWTLALAIFNTLGLIAFALLRQDLDFSNLLSGPITWNISAYTVILLLHLHRMRQERRRQAALALSEARYRRVFESTFEGFLVHNNGAVIDINASMEQVIGTPRAEVIGRTLPDLLEPEVMNQVLRHVGDRARYDIRLHTGADERMLEVETHLFPEIGPQARLVTVRDVTVNRQAQHTLKRQSEILEEAVQARTIELQHANDRLEVLRRFKEEFLASAVHELRTPLANLKLYAHLIREKPEKTGHYLDTVDREVARMLVLVEDLIYISQLDQGEYPMRPAQVELISLIEHLIEDRRLLAAERQISLQLLPGEEAPTLRADPALVERATGELVTNALNYTPRGGTVNVRLTQRAGENAAWVGINMEDTGPGMSEEDQRRMFSRFYRGSAALASGRAGSGLGLSIVQEIASLHRGRVDFENRCDVAHGARFTLWLPLTPP